MITIGIAGGVASGKSVVADQLERLGASLVDADQLGHEVLRQEAVIQAARSRWGDDVVGPDGQIIRPAVARYVFGDNHKASEELEFWESVTHPGITELLKAHLNKAAERDDAVVVLDAPVMFKAGWDRLCDHLIFVDCPRETRLARALQRKNWDEQELAEREAAQLSIDEKKLRASIVIDNSGSLDETYEQVLEFWNSIPR